MTNASASDIVIYHNPRCSKSRETLKLLESRNLQPTVIKYLDTPPDAATLKKILIHSRQPPHSTMNSHHIPITTWP